VGGPANNAGLVFLNPRGSIGASLPRFGAHSAIAEETSALIAAATSGSHVPFSFYFLFIRRAARPGENGLTVPCGCMVGWRGREDPPNELSRGFWSGVTGERAGE